ncbi:MAG: diguanylate cyclase [Candidatus Marinimicrobia bacterium]|nr:diguanylate cyclase [Candidatus Neomarinimicrobiota bacterium]
MSNIKLYWFVGITLILAALVTFVYPSSSIFGGERSTFYLFMKLFITLGTSGLIILLLIDLLNFSRKAKALSKKTEELSKKLHEETEGIKHIQTVVNKSPEEVYSIIITDLLEIMRATFFANLSAFFLVNEEKGILHYEAGNISNLEVNDRIEYKDTIFYDIVRQKKAKVLSGSELNVSNFGELDLGKSASVLIIPVSMGVRIPVGIILLTSNDEGAWGESDIEIGEKFSNLLSNSLWQVDIIERLTSIVNFYQELNKLQAATHLGMDELEFFKKVGDISIKFIDYDKMTIAVYDEDKNQLEIKYVSGIESDITIGDRIDLIGGIWQNILSTDNPIVINDYDSENVDFRFQPDDILSTSLLSGVGIALKSDNKMLGGIIFESKKRNNYTEKDIFAIEIFGKCVGAAYSRLRTYNVLKSLSMVDGLTGIYNRRAFGERLREEINRASRYGGIFSLVIIDVDKFKRINDTYGHLMGDFVLKKLAKIIRGSVRNVDTVARYGGEEFAVILVNANKENAVISAERIKSNVQDFLFEKDNIRLNITISIGLAEYPIDGDDEKLLIQNADMAMYESKRKGGNTVTVYKLKG